MLNFPWIIKMVILFMSSPSSEERMTSWIKADLVRSNRKLRSNLCKDWELGIWVQTALGDGVEGTGNGMGEGIMNRHFTDWGAEILLWEQCFLTIWSSLIRKEISGRRVGGAVKRFEERRIKSPLNIYQSSYMPSYALLWIVLLL